MVKKPYLLLRISRWVWIGLAYYFGVLVVGVLSGAVPLIMGGEPVGVLPVADSPTVPARVFGALNLFISAPISFVILHGIGSLMQAVVEIRERLGGAGSSSG